jgi:hypothetical protein
MNAGGEVVHVAELGRAPLWVFSRLARLAEAWGGSFDEKKGRLELPVLAGLRHGLVIAEVEALAQRDGTKLRLKILESHYQLDRGGTFALLIAAPAALAALVLPFFPRFWPLLPPALVLTLAAWFFVVARLRTSGIEDFLGELRKAAESAEPEQEDAGAL